MFKRLISTVNLQEVDKFSKLASDWWNLQGTSKLLHEMNPLRVRYINSLVKDYFDKENQEINVLDVGCGGGILSEALNRLNYQVLGIDPCLDNIKVAVEHSKDKIEYKQADTSQLLKEPKRFDLILAMEVIEHVDNPIEFVSECSLLLKDKGMIIFSTINRTLVSSIGAKYLAEYVFKLVPKGTHDINKFVTVKELEKYIQSAGLKPLDPQGFVYLPLKGWSLVNSKSMHYFQAAIK